MTELSNNYINSVVKEKIQNLKSKQAILRKIEAVVPKKTNTMSKQQLAVKKDDLKDNILQMCINNVINKEDVKKQGVGHNSKVLFKPTQEIIAKIMKSKVNPKLHVLEKC